jgi:hypothetical protein
LLLSAVGDFKLATAQGLDITDNRTNPAVKQTKRQVLIAEQPALVASHSGQAEDAAMAQALDAMSQADFVIVLTGIDSELNGDFLALLERFAGRFIGRDHEKFDLSEAELVFGFVGANGEDFLDSRQNCLRDERRIVDTLFDTASKHAV